MAERAALISIDAARREGAGEGWWHGAAAVAAAAAVVVDRRLAEGRRQ